MVAGTERVHGRRTWMLDYREDARPTLVKTAGGDDLPSLGRVWVDPASGVILRTRHRTGEGEMQGTITVDFVESKGMSLWVPSRMEELYRSSTSSAVVRGTAEYRDYQRVTVDTVTDVKKPKPD